MNEVIYSDFWLDENVKNNAVDLIRLAGYRRTIANFVTIITGKNIPVTFDSKSDESFTTGERITISAKIKKLKDFDVTVGLALHEASHLLLTDFNFAKKLWGAIPRETYDLAENKGLSKQDVYTISFDILNFIEDRRIDYFIYSTSPGYRGYYTSMYEHFFMSDNINIMLKSQMYRVPSIKSYFYRIVNFLNKNSDYSALPDLNAIINIIDIKHIDRIKTIYESFYVSNEIVKLILKNLPAVTPTPDVNVPPVHSPSDQLVNDLKPSVATSENVDDKGDTHEFSPKELAAIERDLEKQRNFIGGNVKKQTLSAWENDWLKCMEESGVMLDYVGEGLGNNFKLECIVVKKLTMQLINSDDFPLAKIVNGKADSRMEAAVTKGVVLGNILGKRLKIKGESIFTKFPRKSSGKLDKRVIADLGWGNENVFYSSVIEKYNDCNIHLTVDASASMSCGNKWFKTMTAVVAICKAAAMMENIHVSVSFRFGTLISDKGGQIPYIILAYDSRVDRFSKVLELFKFLFPSGCTPEGLAFESLIKHLKIGTDANNYLINFSDGQPILSYSSGTYELEYCGDVAIEHTRRQVMLLKQMGFEILSYYIDSGDVNNYEIDFKRMYGKNSAFININDVLKIAYTLNDLFKKES